MKRFQNLIFALILAVVGGFISILVYTNYFEKPRVITITEPKPVQYASYNPQAGSTDLTYAAENSVKAVVNIQTIYEQNNLSSGNPVFDFFFGNPYQNQEPQIQQAVGSGVIISTDGYIVTNNHVIESSDKIKVTLNDNREFEAKLVGTDPSTDIALIKINENNLPAITWGNSDDLKLGEWVLAVGNPFNLTSTVTAGIVSAKGRGIKIIGAKLPIESFIQTDAAVNPGNSGGALVDTKGELVGINTAIASRTGSYSGYSFAIPVSIVKKVVNDLKQFGEVQRAFLGVRIEDVTSDIAKKLKLEKVAGAHIASVEEDGAAEAAGMKEDDVILSVDGIAINTSNELQEQISKHRPGDIIDVLIKRDSKEKHFNVTLRNTSGGTGIVKDNFSVMGAELEKVNDSVKEKLHIRNGLKIKDLSNGKLKDAGIREGFIITGINKTPITNIDDLKEILKQSSGGVLIEGIYPNGEKAYYVFGLE